LALAVCEGLFTEGYVEIGSRGRTRYGWYWSDSGEDLIRDLPQMKGEVKPDEPLLVCANSHSTRAQHAGFYYVTLNGLNEALEHRHTTGIGLSDLSIPEVRRLIVP
jgi:hypothetical protein